MFKKIQFKYLMYGLFSLWMMFPSSSYALESVASAFNFLKENSIYLNRTRPVAKFHILRTPTNIEFLLFDFKEARSGTRVELVVNGESKGLVTLVDKLATTFLVRVEESLDACDVVEFRLVDGISAMIENVKVIYPHAHSSAPWVVDTFDQNECSTNVDPCIRENAQNIPCERERTKNNNNNNPCISQPKCTSRQAPIVKSSESSFFNRNPMLKAAEAFLEDLTQLKKVYNTDRGLYAEFDSSFSELLSLTAVTVSKLKADSGNRKALCHLNDEIKFSKFSDKVTGELLTVDKIRSLLIKMGKDMEVIDRMCREEK